jgi:phosphoribosylformimino-5-aminoimidazole carboxamide ribotide isomerase
MILFPAIDIKDNKCVRLTQGKFDKVEVYSDDPTEMAQKWEAMGARYLHVVDLDGAKNEGFQNRRSIEKIAKAISIPMQTGGGIRNRERIKNLIDMGVDRVIVGTMAIENKELLAELVKTHQDHIAVSIDALKGKVAIRGWQRVEDVDSIEICQVLETIGIKTIIYTDISKDGMLSGPNFDIYRELSEKVSIKIIASGGVTSLEDIKRLGEMNLYGAIIGKALYDGRVRLADALKVTNQI